MGQTHLPVVTIASQSRSAIATVGRPLVAFAGMGTCILCGEVVCTETGQAWQIVPASNDQADVVPMHWIHGGCIDRAHAATLRVALKAAS